MKLHWDRIAGHCLLGELDFDHDLSGTREERTQKVFLQHDAMAQLVDSFSENDDRAAAVWLASILALDEKPEQTLAGIRRALTRALSVCFAAEQMPAADREASLAELQK